MGAAVANCSMSDGALDPSYHPGRPWFNANAKDNQPNFDEFIAVLRGQLRGGRFAQGWETPNLYFALGFGEAGYGNWHYVATALKSWCDRNDERHPRGWILLTHAQPDRGFKSMESVARFVADRGVPVIALANDFDYCEPGEQSWPTNASAVYFGKGQRHENGEPCRRGFVRDVNGKPTGVVSFPDECMFDRLFDGQRMVDHVAGVFVAGGDQGIDDQMWMYGVNGAGRPKHADEYVPAVDLRGLDSPINRTIPALHGRWPTRQGKIF